MKPRAHPVPRILRPLARVIPVAWWPSLRIVATTLLLLAMYVIGYWYLGRRDLIGDEWAHFQESKDILEYLRSGTPFKPVHPAIPGYHLINALAGLAANSQDLNFFRAVSVVLSALTVPAFYLAARSLWGKRLLILRTLQYAFLPVAFPFFFLLYTDVPSLLPLLLCFLAVQKRWYTTAGLLAFLIIGFRQNNVIWVLMFLLLICLREWHGWSLRALWGVVRRSLVMGLSIVALGIFVIINGGLALADEGAHPASFHTGNFFTMALFLVCMMFPIIALQPSRFVREVAQQGRWLLPGGALSLFFYVVTFKNDHGYNFDRWWIRNKVLLFFTSAPWLQTLYYFAGFFLAAAIAIRTRFAKKDLYLYYPFTVLYLGASWLVEPRYFLVPLTLFLLFRRMERWWVELGILVVFIVQAAWLYYGGWQGWYLP